MLMGKRSGYGYWCYQGPTRLYALCGAFEGEDLNRALHRAGFSTSAYYVRPHYATCYQKILKADLIFIKNFNVLNK